MTPAKRRPAKSASQAPKAAKNDSTQLLGPDGEPIAQEAPPADAGGDSASPTEPGQADPDAQATTQSSGHRALHPQRVWPD